MDVKVFTVVWGLLFLTIIRFYIELNWMSNVHQSIPAFNLRVLPFIFRYRGLPKVCFTSEFKAHFYWAEKVWAAFITVFQGSNNVSRACQGFEELNLFERICHCVTALKSVAVPEQDLDTLVIIPFSSEYNGAAVYLQTAHTREWSSSVDKLSGFVVLTPLQDGVERVWLLLHGGAVHGLLHQLRGVCQSFNFLVTLQIF